MNVNFRRWPMAWLWRTTQHEALWAHIREFTPKFLAANPDGAVVRASCTLKEA